MKWLEWPLGLVDRVVAIALGLTLIAITAILFINAMARYFAGFAIIGGEEMARCLMVWMTFLGAYLLVRTRSHISIDILSRSLSARDGKALHLVTNCLGILVCGYFFYLGYQLTDRIFLSGQTMSSLPLLRGWFYLSIPVGMGLMTLAFLQLFMAALTGLKQPEISDFSLATTTPQSENTEPGGA